MFVPFILKQGRNALIIALTLGSGTVQANIAVFIHGFHSSAAVWRSAGVFSPLRAAGWFDGGGYRFQGWQAVGPNRRPIGDNLLLTVELPNNAPILYQVGYLRAALQSIRQYAPREPVSLVGHSAGGIVARTAMVLFPDLHIAQLVTIASPNLGARLASAGSKLVSSPVGLFARLAGEHEFSRAGKLLADLSPEARNNFLGWLNTRQHPAGDYVAIIHARSNPGDGDEVAPSGSQDLRHVTALAGQARSFVTPAPHGLTRADGAILAALLLRADPQKNDRSR